MANMSIFYEIARHATANPSNVLAAEGAAHMYSILLESDTDNGNLVAAGEWDSLDLFKEAAVTEFEGEIVEQMGNGNYLVLVKNPGDALLVYQIPIAAEEYSNKWKSEHNMYNAAGDVVRCYGLVKHDRFEVSKEAFEGEPSVGATITGVSNKKMVIG